MKSTRVGSFYSVGTGPGDSRLLTLLAIETIRKCAVIAVPDSGAAENAVLKIVDAYMEGKEVVFCPMAMTRDKKTLESCHERSGEQLRSCLDKGLDVAFLTLGDPSIYSTPMYVHKRLKLLGYQTHIIPGVPSFCAAAAALNVALCEGGQLLHIIPASYNRAQEALHLSGTKVLMKSGRSICDIKSAIKAAHCSGMAVERCGMDGEIIHESLGTITEDASYYSILIVKEDDA